jgi:small subunit ribosomal protein S8
VRNGYGISIISTSKGLMTGQEARKRNIGGELICKIW